MIKISSLYFILFIISATCALGNTLHSKEAQDIFKSVRCIVCESQSITESNSEFAQDLRTIILEKLNQGETRNNIEKFLIARYGDSILFSTPMNEYTLLLWIAPIMFFMLGIFIIVK